MELKKDMKDRELKVVAKKIYYEKQDPIRLRLRKTRCVDVDESLKRIYRIKN